MTYRKGQKLPGSTFTPGDPEQYEAWLRQTQRKNQVSTPNSENVTAGGPPATAETSTQTPNHCEFGEVASRGAPASGSQSIAELDFTEHDNAFGASEFQHLPPAAVAAVRLALGEWMAAQATSTQPPNDPNFGEVPTAGHSVPPSQPVSEQNVTAGDSPMPGDELQHQPHQRVAAGDVTRPPRQRGKLSDEEKTAVAVHLAYGMSLRQAAAKIERHYSTISRLLKRDEKFAALVRQQRELPGSEAIAEICRASRKSWRAAAWLLTYLERKQERQRERKKRTS